MQVFTTIQSLRDAIRSSRQQQPTPQDVQVGLVPTMGALHAGHLSLVEHARSECGIVVASLFVNPTQFLPGEDFERYPRQFRRDFDLFEGAGVNFLFSPAVDEMYPTGSTTLVDVGELGTRLDGAFRPGHFRGVATVVSKLFHIASPDRAYFGQKDAAQVAVLRQMVRDLNFDITLVSCPIVRDPDGLAMSSRNIYLSMEERTAALVLPRTLELLRTRIKDGRISVSELLRFGKAILASTPCVMLEYLEAVDSDTLLPVDSAQPGTLFALAAKVGRTRLIDNFVV